MNIQRISKLLPLRLTISDCILERPLWPISRKQKISKGQVSYIEITYKVELKIWKKHLEGNSIWIKNWTRTKKKKKKQERASRQVLLYGKGRALFCGGVQTVYYWKFEMENKKWQKMASNWYIHGVDNKNPTGKFVL